MHHSSRQASDRCNGCEQQCDGSCDDGCPWGDVAKLFCDSGCDGDCNGTASALCTLRNPRLTTPQPTGAVVDVVPQAGAMGMDRQTAKVGWLHLWPCVH
jgi:hypothetical protein